MVPRANPSPQPKRQLDRCSRFCRAHKCDRPTGRPTDHATRSVRIGRIYVRSTAMRPKKINQHQQCKWKTSSECNVIVMVTETANSCRKTVQNAIFHSAQTSNWHGMKWTAEHQHTIKKSITGIRKVPLNFISTTELMILTTLKSVFSVCLSVCVSVNRSVVEQLRPQFFTDFREILHAAHKCGCFIAYCLWDKPGRK